MLFLWIELKLCKRFWFKYKSKILSYILSLKFIIPLTLPMEEFQFYFIFFLFCSHTFWHFFLLFIFLEYFNFNSHFLLSLLFNFYISFPFDSLLSYSFFSIFHFFSNVFFSLLKYPNLRPWKKEGKTSLWPLFFFHSHQTCDLLGHFGITTTCPKWTKCCVDDDVFFHHGKRQSKKQNGVEQWKAWRNHGATPFGLFSKIMFCWS